MKIKYLPESKVQLFIQPLTDFFSRLKSNRKKFNFHLLRRIKPSKISDEQLLLARFTFRLAKERNGMIVFLNEGETTNVGNKLYISIKRTTPVEAIKVVGDFISYVLTMELPEKRVKEKVDPIQRTELRMQKAKQISTVMPISSRNSQKTTDITLLLPVIRAIIERECELNDLLQPGAERGYISYRRTELIVEELIKKGEVIRYRKATKWEDNRGIDIWLLFDENAGWMPAQIKSSFEYAMQHKIKYPDIPVLVCGPNRSDDEIIHQLRLYRDIIVNASKAI